MRLGLLFATALVLVNSSAFGQRSRKTSSDDGYQVYLGFVAEENATADKYLKATNCDCPEKMWIEERVRTLEGQMTNTDPQNYGPMAFEAKSRHAKLSFDFADTALKRGCLDDADKMYRHLIRFYVGGAYSGIRDRARLGIDDVRAKRPVPGAQQNPPAPLEVVSQPPHGTASAQTPDPDEELRYRAAQDLFKKEDYAGALNGYEELLLKYPSGAYAANASYWKAHSLFKIGDYQRSIIGFDQFREKFPHSEKIPSAMHNEAVAYTRSNQKSKAIELFQQLIKEHPDDPATSSSKDQLRQLQAGR